MNKLLLTTILAVAAVISPARAAGLIFSDHFERVGLTACTLGLSDNAVGGVMPHSYVPIFPLGGTDASNPVGAIIGNGVLQNVGQDFGGVQFSASALPCGGSRGADLGQDLTIRVRLRVPTDAIGRVTYAGPYFRSRRSASGDGIVGGLATDPSGGYWVQLLSTGEIRVLRLDSNEVVARTLRPLAFDANAFHHLEVSVTGDLLQIALDGGLERFTEPVACALLVRVPNTGAGNQGAAGIAFGTESRGEIGGQQADDLEVYDQSSLASFPTGPNPALSIHATNTLVLRGNSQHGSVELSVCDILNEGIIQLDSVDSGWTASVKTFGYLTNAPGALIDVLRGAGGARIISSDVVNLGTLRLETDLALNRPFGLFDNRGQVDLGTNVVLSFDSSGGQVFNQNAGTLKLGDNSRLEGAGGKLNLSGGTVNNGSNVVWRSLQFNYSGGQITGTSPYLYDTKIQIGANAAPVTLLVAANLDQLIGDLPAGQTLWIQGNSAAGSGYLTATNGFANHGLLRLEAVDSGWTSSLTVTSGTLTNAADGVITFGLGAQGARLLSADTLNRGTINVQQDLSLNKPGGVFENQATLSVDAGRNFFFESSGNQILNQTAGMFALGDNTRLEGSGGKFNLNGGTVQNGSNVVWRSLQFNYSGGQITGPAPYLYDTKIQIGTEAAPTTLLVVANLDQLIGDLPAGQTLWIQGNGPAGSGYLTATNGFSNHGRLRLEAVDSGWTSSLTVTGGILTNATDGLITFGLGALGARLLTADTINQGTITAQQDLTLNKPGGIFENRARFTLETDRVLSFESSGGQQFNQTAGTLTLGDNSRIEGAGGRFNLSGGTVQTGTNLVWRSLDLNYTGGQITGPSPYLYNSKIQIGPGAAPVTLLVMANLNVLGGDLPAGQTLWIQGSGAAGSSYLTATNTLANHGVVRLESVDSGWTSSFTVTGGTLVNATSGRIVAERGAGGARILNAELLNQGKLQVNQDLSLPLASTITTNAGSVEIGSGATLDIAGGYKQTAGETSLKQGTIRVPSPLQLVGGTLTGAGTVQGDVENAATIRPEGGTLAITGKLAQSGAGTLAFKTKGMATDMLDGLTVSGAVTLGGTLRVEASPGYTLAKGDLFQLVRAASITGTFAKLELPALPEHLVWTTTYNATSVAIQVTRAPGTVAFDSVKLLADGQFQFTFSGTINQAYTIETSTNLLQWATLTNFVQTANLFQFLDADTTNSPVRFYRALAR